MTADWKALLARAVEQDPRGRAGVAEKMGYSRAAISLALSGRYIASSERIARAVIDHYDHPDCVIFNKTIERSLCRRLAAMPEPRGGDARVRWLTCQTCVNKPSRGREPRVESREPWVGLQPDLLA